MSGHENSESVCVTIVETVAAEEAVDPVELEPLHSTVDTDALERLVEDRSSRNLRVEFEYCGYEVLVKGDGRVAVEGSTE